MSELTVPRAPATLGRTANVDTTPTAGQAAGAIAQLGNKMLEIGTRLQTERRQRTLRKTELDITRDMGLARLEVDQIADPERIGPEWDARVADIRARYINEDTDPEVAQALDLSLQQLGDRHGLALSGRVIELERSAVEADWIGARAAIVTEAGIADPTTVGALIEIGEAGIDARVQAGQIDPAAGAKEKQALRAEVQQARATRLLSENPAALVAAIDAGDYDELGPVQGQGWRARAVSAVATGEARAEAEAKRARDQYIGDAKDFLRNGTAVMRRGADFAGAVDAAAILSDPEIAALPEAREFVATWQLMVDQPGLAVMPLADKRAMLADLKDQPADRPFEVDRIDALEKMIAADEKGFRDDPLTYAESIGLRPPPALPDPGSTDPATLGAALQARRNHAASLVSQGYADKLVLFTPEEREEWARLADPAASPADRAALAATMTAALDDDAEAALATLTDDPVMPFIGGGMQFGLSELTARQVFEGRRIIDSQQVRMPATPMRRQAFFSEFQGLFEDGTTPGWDDQSEALKQVTEAADGLYAYRMRGKLAGGKDAEGRIDEVVYLQAVHEVMGGTGRYDRSDARGGVQEINGWLTILPADVSGRDVKKRLDHLGKGGGLLGWNGISATGNLPAIGGELPDAATMRRVHLRAVGPNEYVMIYTNAETGDQAVINGDDGGAYVLRMSAMMALAP